jgi:hypothetical protein
MATPYSPALRVGQFLKATNIPQEFLSGVTGISTGALSQFLNDKRPLSAMDERKCLDTVKVIQSLIDRTAPIPINFHPRCAGIFKKILEDYEKRLLLVSVVSLNLGTPASDEVAIAATRLDRAMQLLVGNNVEGNEHGNAARNISQRIF